MPYKDLNKKIKQRKIYYNINKNKIIKESLLYHKNNPWRKPLNHAKNRCNNINNKRYKDYGARGIKCLITLDEIKELWFRDKAYELKQPSIDRINNDGNYTFENCRFIELKENTAKDKRKSILQFNKEGKFIKEYVSIMDASRVLNVNHSAIVRNLKNKSKSAYNFIWKYKNA